MFEEDEGDQGRESAQLRLLDLQTVDTTLAQLHHRRQTLPQHAVIAKLRTASGGGLRSGGRRDQNLRS